MYTNTLFSVVCYHTYCALEFLVHFFDSEISIRNRLWFGVILHIMNEFISCKLVYPLWSITCTIYRNILNTHNKDRVARKELVQGHIASSTDEIYLMDIVNGETQI